MNSPISTRENICQIASGRALNLLIERLNTLLNKKAANISLLRDAESFSIKAVSNHNNNSVRVTFNRPSAILRLLTSPRLITFADLFIDSKVSFEGDISLLIDFADSLTIKPETGYEKILYVLYYYLTVLGFWKFKTKKGIKHYEIDSNVYRLFLDDHMQYTCGFFEHDNESISKAQLNKFKYIKRITNLQPGALHLDVGCGWGGLINYFCDTYRTISTGITNCPKQASLAKGILNNKACILDVDFFDFNPPNQFDIITIVGMLEHVPESLHEKLFQKICEILRPGGKVYLQCITKSDKWVGGDGSRFLDRYVYTGYFIEAQSVLLGKIKKNNFNIIETRSDPHHYALTTKLWVQALQEHRREILKYTTERQYRILLGYLALAGNIFGDGRGMLSRITFERPS